MLVRSCFLITVIKCLKGDRSLRLLFNVKKTKGESVSQWQGHLLSCQVTAKKLKIFSFSNSYTFNIIICCVKSHHTKLVFMVMTRVGRQQLSYNQFHDFLPLHNSLWPSLLYTWLHQCTTWLCDTVIISR